MADKPTPTPNDILGIIQRHLVQLHIYAALPQHMVDPNALMQGMEECAVWIQQLPPPPRVQQQDGEAARPN